MTDNDKALYHKRRERQLSDFYIDAIPYVKKYVPQKDISIEFYHDHNLTIVFQGESKEQAHYFKYVMKKEG